MKCFIRISAFYHHIILTSQAIPSILGLGSVSINSYFESHASVRFTCIEYESMACSFFVMVTGIVSSSSSASTCCLTSRLLQPSTSRPVSMWYQTTADESKCSSVSDIHQPECSHLTPLPDALHRPRIGTNLKSLMLTYKSIIVLTSIYIKRLLKTYIPSHPPRPANQRCLELPSPHEKCHSRWF